MNRSYLKPIASAILGGACLFAASTGSALDIYLRADTFTKNLPDGKAVQMWGFALENSTWSSGATASSPGPRIDVPPADTTLIIHLRNNLSSNVSLVIPNQNGYLRAGSEHATFTDSEGRERARSFVKEAAANGGEATYQWDNLTPGTYLYYSGSHSALQVQMGLYGAVVRKSSATEAYPGWAPHRESLLLFSEIDPAVHDAVQNGTYGAAAATPTLTSTIHSVPRYFLINGSPYTDGQASIAAGYTNETIMLRLLNAGVNSRIPTILGLHQKTIAEDGRLYPYSKELAAPELPALKTMDTVITTTSGGVYPLYDRCLGLVNGTQADGGMLTFLGVGQTFPRAGTVIIPSGTTVPPAPYKAVPYPAGITVAGVSGTVGKVVVSFNLVHSRPTDVDILLQSPDGTRVVLMSDVGGAPFSGTITFDDDALSSLTAAPLVTGTYKPSNLAPDEVFPAPAGTAPYAATLSAFNGVNPNGTWNLYVMDDTLNVGGFITNVRLSIVPAK